MPVNLTGAATGGTVNFSLDSNTNTIIADEPSIVITSVAEIVAFDLKIYPNPFTGEVRILGAGAVETRHATSVQMQIQIQIFNAAGALVHVQMITGADETINLEHLPAGMYIFRFEKDGYVRTVRVVKE